MTNKPLPLLIRELFLAAGSITLSALLIACGFGLAMGLVVRTYRWVVG